MKTYTKTVEVTKPRLEIYLDRFAENPRDWHCAGYLLSASNKYIDDTDVHTPDRPSTLHTAEELKEIMMDVGMVATSLDDHIKRMHKETDNQYHIFPIVRYEHGNVSYRLGSIHGFDYSNDTFYFAPKTSETKRKRQAEKVIAAELEEYSSWCSGEIYAVSIYDEVGELVDYNSGYYDIDDLKADLPSEWQSEDLEQYWVR
ncbi:MAG: hypothetical protein ACRBBN_06825 [Methyloligellaceae bacterium]